ncbi:MAG: phage holin [Lachnospiraceae bacterium]|nr:phage holin [Lachnospiraceae bacterium]
MINWKVRIKNKNFWLAIIPAIIVLIQAVASVFGVKLDLGDIGNKLIAVVNAAFVVLAILGIVTDPTTEGISDSISALGYEKPRKSDINGKGDDE